MVLRAVLVMAAATLALATAAPAGAGPLEDCGQRVIRDWYSGGRVDKVYPLPCYRAAIRALPNDVLQYTDASAAIERALETARRGTATPEPSTTPEERPAPSAPTASITPRGTGTAPSSQPAARPPRDPAPLASGPAHDAREPGVPYPLIALGALSVVLLASGIAAGLIGIVKSSSRRSGTFGESTDVGAYVTAGERAT